MHTATSLDDSAHGFPLVAVRITTSAPPAAWDRAARRRAQLPGRDRGRERLAEIFKSPLRGRRRTPRPLGREHHHRGARRHLRRLSPRESSQAGRFLRIKGRFYPAATEAITEHVGSVVTDVLLHSEGLPARLLSRYCAERAAPVEIDREAIERLGVRVQRARCCPTRFTSSCAHDPDRLALAVHDLGAEVRRLAR